MERCVLCTWMGLEFPNKKEQSSNGIVVLKVNTLHAIQTFKVQLYYINLVIACTHQNNVLKCHVNVHSVS